MQPLKQRIARTPVFRWYKACRVRSRIRDEFRRREARYIAHAAFRPLTTSMTGKQFEAQIIKDTHRVERGLALHAPKRPFGADLEACLDLLLPQAKREAPDSAYVQQAEEALAALRAWNSENDISETTSAIIDITARGFESPKLFFGTRRSVRNFSDRPALNDFLEHATEFALSTPSVYNRQGWYLRYYRGREALKALSFQNGNRGFGDNIPVVGLATVNTRVFAAASERNQAWIEGGLFFMTLAWALHALRLDTCILNLSIENSRADELRSQLNFDSADLPITMRAIGAAGPRRSSSFGTHLITSRFFDKQYLIEQSAQKPHRRVMSRVYVFTSRLRTAKPPNTARLRVSFAPKPSPKP